jgi:DNA replication protein DnaC
MTQTYFVPMEWKSEQWWNHRPLEERLFHLHLPARIKEQLRDGAIDPYCATWEPGKSLLIAGKSGTGKSFQAADILDGLIRTHPISGRWVEADDYIDMIKDSFDNDGLLPEMYSSPHLVKYIKGVFDVVVLDGLGEERLTEFAAHELGSLIRKRFDRMKSTIITSSLTLVDIKHRYGSRLAAALADFDQVGV